MKRSIPMLAMGCAVGMALMGCASNPNSGGVTNPSHPGPAAGRAVGAGAGLVVGNAAGAVVGAGEGFAVGAAAPFKNETPTRRVVRTWRSETTPDGRVIQVPVETMVDEYGRPIRNAPANQPPSK